MITIEEICGYLPYELKGICTDDVQGIEVVSGISWTSAYLEVITNIDACDIVVFKPLLRPLSSLTTDDGFDMYIDLCEELGLTQCEHFIKALTDGTYYAMDVKQYETARQWLYKNHFDLHGLIERGDALNLLEYKQ